MSTARTALYHDRKIAVSWLRRVGEPELADALERGEHRAPRPRNQGTNHHWACGHPRTDENTVRVGRTHGTRCATCRRAINAASKARVKARV